jgi:AraC-like DNA-binding protein
MGSYMRSICLDRARYLLRETDAAVSTIAEQLCFASLYSFSIFFKRGVGISPLEYRRQTRSDTLC